MAKSPTIHCSFCGRNRDEVKILIAGQDGHICENCIEHAHEIIVKEFHQKKVEGKAGTLKVQDRKSTRLNSSHSQQSRMPSSA